MVYIISFKICYFAPQSLKKDKRRFNDCLINHSTQKINIMETTKGINKKAFVSSGLFISGIGILFSGIISQLLLLESTSAPKQFWMSVNSILGVLFLFFSIFHLSYNKKTLIRFKEFLASKFLSKELILATILICILLFAAVVHSFEM